MRQGIGPTGAHGNSDAFDGIKYQQTQLTVEDVQVQNIFKLSARLEHMGGMVGLERQPVGP